MGERTGCRQAGAVRWGRGRGAWRCSEAGVGEGAGLKRGSSSDRSAACMFCTCSAFT